MANQTAKVKQVEIRRTVKGVVDAGVDVGRVEVDHRSGKVIVWPAGQVKPDGQNPCDELLK